MCTSRLCTSDVTDISKLRVCAVTTFVRRRRWRACTRRRLPPSPRPRSHDLPTEPKCVPSQHTRSEQSSKAVRRPTRSANGQGQRLVHVNDCGASEPRTSEPRDVLARTVVSRLVSVYDERSCDWWPHTIATPSNVRDYIAKKLEKSKFGISNSEYRISLGISNFTRNIEFPRKNSILKLAVISGSLTQSIDSVDRLSGTCAASACAVSGSSVRMRIYHKLFARSRK